MMSQKEREYLKELARVKKKEMRLSDASRVLGLSYRHTRRIYKRYVEEGDQGLVHRSRGKKSNRAYQDQFRKEVIARYKTRYEGFGPTLGSEKLEEEDGLKGSRNASTVAHRGGSVGETSPSREASELARAEVTLWRDAANGWVASRVV
jgi:molybdenum-dependent DNA-binding transcriptional regulator ModE